MTPIYEQQTLINWFLLLMTNPFLHFYLELMAADVKTRKNRVDSMRIAHGLILFVAVASADKDRSTEELALLASDVVNRSKEILTLDHLTFSQHLFTIVILMTKLRSL
jgi:hypothetical protein